MSTEDTVYFYAKCVEAMVYKEDLDTFLDDLESYFIMDEKTILTMLSTFIEMNKNYMNNQMKNNAYKIVQYYKEKCIEKEVSVQEITNLLIRQINITDDKKIKSLVKNEFNLRYGNFFITYIALKNFDESLDYIKEMVEMDFNILVNHSSFYDDESFEEIKELCTKNIIDYVGCINMITKEHPNLLSSKLFMSRVKKVVDAVDMNDKKMIKKFKKNMGI